MTDCLLRRLTTWVVCCCLGLLLTANAMAAEPIAADSPTQRLAAAPSAAPRIGVMTMRPGNIFWERFGHDALVVQDPVTGESLNYNFGFFDPTAPDFVSRFARGEMRYQLAVLTTEQDLSVYRAEGRGVQMQWLNLSPERARELDQALRLNAQPQNAFYDYRYFTDNCATRVRDAVDRTFGGALRSQLESRSQGLTYRSEAVRLADDALWMRYLFDLGLGPQADRPMSRWEESFVPGRLATALADLQVDGKPVVAGTQTLLEHQLRPDATDPNFQWLYWLLVGAVVGAMLLWLRRRTPRGFGITATVIWLLFSLFGATLLYLWLFTAHNFAFANRNLWLMNPLALLPMLAWWRRNPRLLQVSSLLVHVILPVVAVFEFWSLLPQRNAHWIALLLPIHVALYLACRPVQWGK